VQVIVGVFWPSMMTMRAHYVPEEIRSTIINCFRIPLNLFVCIILYNVSEPLRLVLKSQGGEPAGMWVAQTYPCLPLFNLVPFASNHPAVSSYR
jgi:hypothetical protein